MFSVEKYLERIDYRGGRTPTTVTLRALHDAHIVSVPFENLDVLRGLRVVLSEEAIYEKIVERMRGGVCAELNASFARLLTAIGFHVAMLSVRVLYEPPNTKRFGASWSNRSLSAEALSPDFEHMALRVVAEGVPFLVDVGFSHRFSGMPALEEGAGDAVDAVQYSIDRCDETWRLFRREPSKEIELVYQFELTPRTLSEFEPRNTFFETSPESRFNKHRLIFKKIPNGHVFMKDLLLVHRDAINGRNQPRLLKSEEEFDRTIKEQFGLVVPCSPLAPE